ncbi:MAG: radical SAM protein [Deltaproteobacteria bacterium]|nr:radical SAM protein [Deltaproteobacteria bacterium]
MTAQSDTHDWQRQVELVVVPSFACNLRCTHCFIGRRATRSSMGARDFLALVDQVGKLGLRAMQLTGGEPFAWRHHDRALPALAELGIPAAVSTNGALLYPAAAAALAGSSVSLCLSLDGPPRTHDQQRGVGAFASTEAAAALCRQHDIRFDISSVVTRASLPEVAATTAAAAALGASAIYFSPLQRLGGRSDKLADQRLTDDECVELLAALTVLRDHVPAGFRVFSQNLGMRPTAVKSPCSVFACWGEFCPSQKRWPSRLYVLPDGTVLPQSLHIHPRYALGNAFREGLDVVIGRYWGSAKHAEFQALCRYVYQDLIYGSRRPFFFWDELVRWASDRPAGELPVYTTVTHPHDHTEEIARARRQDRLPLISFPIRAGRSAAG